MPPEPEEAYRKGIRGGTMSKGALWTRINEIRAENEKLPKLADGRICSPRYLPPNLQKVWSKYCRETPRSSWPTWLQNDVKYLTHRSKVTSASRPSIGSSATFTPSIQAGESGES